MYWGTTADLLGVGLRFSPNMLSSRSSNSFRKLISDRSGMCLPESLYFRRSISGMSPAAPPSNTWPSNSTVRARTTATMISQFLQRKCELTIFILFLVKKKNSVTALCHRRTFLGSKNNCLFSCFFRKPSALKKPAPNALTWRTSDVKSQETWTIKSYFSYFKHIQIYSTFLLATAPLEQSGVKCLLNGTMGHRSPLDRFQPPITLRS